MKPRSPRARVLRLSAAVVAAGAFVSASAVAADPVGAPFGPGSISAEILSVDGESDVDDYVAPLLKGETISVTVAATGKSKLLPDLRLIDPTGADRTGELGLKLTNRGRTASFKPFAADRTGSWAIRVAGTSDTQGLYTATVKIREATRLLVKKGVLGGDAPRTATHQFEAPAGAVVSFVLKPTGKSGTVQFGGIRYPSGTAYNDVSGAVAPGKQGSLVLEDFKFGAIAGTYEIDVKTTDETATYSLDLRVDPQPRKKGKQRFKLAEPRITAEEALQRVASFLLSTFSGRNLSIDPEVRVLVGGQIAQVRDVADDGTSVTVSVPALAETGTFDVVVINSDGQAFTREDRVYVVPRPVLTDVIDATGVSVRQAPTAGGDALRLIGSGFDSFTTVQFGTTNVGVDAVTDSGTLAITSPALPRGTLAVSVTDDFGRTSTLSDSFLLPFHGWGEGDGGRLPAQGAADSHAAASAAVADIDGDGRADDFVIAAPIRSASEGTPRLGTRETQTRLFVEGSSKTFSDGTDARFPAGLSQAFPFDTDDWNGHDVAIGDLDGGQGGDIVIGGFSETYADGFATDTLYGSNRFAAGLRLFTRDTGGAFSLAKSDLPIAQRLRPDATCKDSNGATRPLFGRFAPERGDPSALAIGDLDRDGDLDVVLARREYSFRRVRQDVANVDFTKDPPEIAASFADAYVPSADIHYAYIAGTEIIDNGIVGGGELRYVTENRMPLSFGGYSTGYTGTATPGFHADDVVIAEIDGVNGPDIVITWRDPTTVSVAGLKSWLQAEHDGVDPPVSTDGPRVATRVLLNDGTGRFTDATSTWMPAGAQDEWWQGTKLAAEDVDGDGAPDLVITHSEGHAAWAATALATVSATPTGTTLTPGTLSAGESDTYAFTVTAAGRYVIDVAPGTLADPVVSVRGPNSESVVVATNDDGGAGTASRLSVDLTPGTWYARVSAFSGADTGTYTLSVRSRPDVVPAVSHGVSATRVLRNDRTAKRFVNVTPTAIPALPDGDDFRADALRVADADGDGKRDILIATTDRLATSAAAPLSSFRVLLGNGSGVFTHAPGLSPSLTLDTGEAEEIVLLPSPDRDVERSILLVSRTRPATSRSGRYMRLLDWNR